MPTAGVTSASDLISGYFFFNASSSAVALGLELPEKLKVWMKCTLAALGPASSVKRPPDGPQWETIGTSQPMRSSDFTTCADGATLAAARTAPSVPAARPPTPHGLPLPRLRPGRSARLRVADGPGASMGQKS